MKHQIDPKVDCVFKALLGAEENRNLLIHFLNAVLGDDLEAPIVTAVIVNPYNEKEFLSDKLSVVDVKAQDEQQRLYQIEVQLSNYEALRARIAYGWADLYSQQLHSGQDYRELRPTYAIWLLRDPLFHQETQAIHDFRLRDRQGRLLVDCGGIWLLELSKMTLDQVVNEQQRWLKFFREGEQLNDAAPLPEWMNTEEMRQAMNTLRQFSEKERNYHLYQARQNLSAPADDDSERDGGRSAGKGGGLAGKGGGLAGEGCGLAGEGCGLAGEGCGAATGGGGLAGERRGTGGN